MAAGKHQVQDPSPHPRRSSPWLITGVAAVAVALAAVGVGLLMWYSSRGPAVVVIHQTSAQKDGRAPLSRQPSPRAMAKMAKIRVAAVPWRHNARRVSPRAIKLAEVVFPARIQPAQLLPSGHRRFITQNLPFADVPSFPTRHDVHHLSPTILTMAQVDLPSVAANDSSLNAGWLSSPPMRHQRSTSLYVSRAIVPAFDPSNTAALQREQQSFRREQVQQKKMPRAPPQFVMSLAKASDGAVWVGTEDDGVYRYDASGRYEQFTTRDGLGDNNIYAMAVDHQGRVWVGHLNHGVSVYNGDRWQNYEIVGGLSSPKSLSGPLGERVFDIAVCPTSGDVWIATNACLARYGVSTDMWRYYDQAHGLPTDHVQTLAFDQSGNLYCGMSCDGLAIASAADDYQNWRHVTGPHKASFEPQGSGLPGNLINDVLVTNSGSVYVATTNGLGRSKDHGRTWHYWRGADWADKVRGLNDGAPAGWTEKPGAWLLEDHITCLAEGPDGLLWIGYWREGWQAVDPATGRTVAASTGSDNLYINSIVPLRQGQAWLGCYGEGLTHPSHTLLHGSAAENVAAIDGEPFNARASSRHSFPSMPSSAGPPSDAQLQPLLARLESIALVKSADQPLVLPLTDDWRTEGEWLGRYGRYWACLAAMATHDYLWGTGAEPVQYTAFIGPHHQAHDSIRYWVHWLYTNRRGSLEIPPVYLDSRIIKGLTTAAQDRRQSEWDDHGEVYPATFEGPDLYCTLKIPAGVYRLSLYDMNKDGHDQTTRCRDFPLSIRAHQDSKGLADISGFNQQPQLAGGRIKDFWHGVWKRYLVRGPTELTIRAAKSGSVDTILAGVVLDELDQCPSPYFTADQAAAVAQWGGDLPGRILQRLRILRDDNPAAWAAHHNVYGLLLRRLWQADAKSTLAEPTLAQLGECEYQMDLYPQWEECQKKDGMRTAREIEKALRWDRHSNYGGKGRQTVAEYVQGQKAEMWLDDRLKQVIDILQMP